MWRISNRCGFNGGEISRRIELREPKRRFYTEIVHTVSSYDLKPDLTRRIQRQPLLDKSLIMHNDNTHEQPVRKET